MISSTTEEDYYEYRVEWDNIITVDYDYTKQNVKVEHHGPGSRDNPDFIGVKLIKIESNIF